MNQFFFVIAQTVHLFLGAMTMLLLGRALLGLFFDEESPLLVFCSVVTEPIVAPVRKLLSLFPGLQESPIDFSFMATYLIIMIVQLALPL